MIYPENFEQKIGFDEIRTLLKGRCMSTLGTEWVDHQVQFMTDYDSIIKALTQAQEFARFCETEDDVYEENFFDLRRPLLRIQPENTHLEELELFDLKRSLMTIHTLTSFFCKHNDEDAYTYPALAEMATGIVAFPNIIRRIDEVLNKYGKIKDTASPELLSIRHQAEVTVRSISHNLRTIISDAQKDGYIDRDVSPTLRDGRLVIPVAPSVKRKIKGIVHDESATGKTVFIEPATVVEANNRVRELKAAEKREIIRILSELSKEIRLHIPDLLASMHYLAHIDYLRALANFATSFSATVPQVHKYPCLDWVQAVHPLLQQALKKHGAKQVPLDVTLKGKERLLLISGPNAGGKSVCLKTIGLLQYMLQCGMPVPMRENSNVGIFKDIFLSIGDEQDIENELSTYSSHLLGLKEMMKRSNAKSMLLIDEFGSGTEPQIGGALAEGILDRFVRNGTYGVITTHYQNLKNYVDACPTAVNGAMLYDRSRMQPLFMLRIGHPGSSFAIEIARKIGLPAEVVAYAESLVGKDYVMSDKYLQDIARDKMYWETKREKVHRQEKQLEATLANYEQEVEQFKAQKKSVIAQAKAEAQELLQQSNAKIENTIRAIREAQADKERTKEIRKELSDFKETLSATDDNDADIRRQLEKIKRRQQHKRNPKTPSGKTESSAAPTKSVGEQAVVRRDFREGDFVRLKGQTTVGRIEHLQGRQAKILFGSMYTAVPISRLEPAEAPQTEKITQVATFISKDTRDAVYQKKLHFRPETDLRGMRADEALEAVTHFIDDAILLEQPRVRILHGTGTGALRELVRQYLRTVPGVKTFRDEHVQFGGAGITVVEFE